MSFTYVENTFPHPVHERPITGVCNDSNVTFTLKYLPVPNSLRLRGSQSGNLFSTGDYTLSGQTITMNVAPSTGETLDADYETLT